MALEFAQRGREAASGRHGAVRTMALGGLLWVVFGATSRSDAFPSPIVVPKVFMGTINVDGDINDIAIENVLILGGLVLENVQRDSAAGTFLEGNDCQYDLAIVYDNEALYFGVNVIGDDIGGLDNDSDGSPFRSDALMVFLDPGNSRHTRPRSTDCAFVMVAGDPDPPGRDPVPLAGTSLLRIGNGRDFIGTGFPAGEAAGLDDGPHDDAYTFEGKITFAEIRRRTGLPVPVPRSGESWGIDFQFIDSEAEVNGPGTNGRLQVWAPASPPRTLDEMERVAVTPSAWGQVVFFNTIGDPDPDPLAPQEPVEPMYLYHGDVPPYVEGWSMLGGFAGGLGEWSVLAGSGTSFLRVTDDNSPYSEAMVFGRAWRTLRTSGGTLVARMRLVDGVRTNNGQAANASLIGYDEDGAGCALSFRDGNQAVLTGRTFDSIVGFLYDLNAWHTYWMVYYPAGSVPQVSLYIEELSIELAAWQPERYTDVPPPLVGMLPPAVVFGSASAAGTVEIDVDWLAVLPEACVFDANAGGFRTIGMDRQWWGPTCAGAGWRLYE